MQTLLQRATPVEAHGRVLSVAGVGVGQTGVFVAVVAVVAGGTARARAPARVA